MRMKDKVALISGAASGMGAATARLFAREGAKAVVVADLLDKEGEAVVAEHQEGRRQGDATSISTSPTRRSGRPRSTRRWRPMAASTCW